MRPTSTEVHLSPFRASSRPSRNYILNDDNGNGCWIGEFHFCRFVHIITYSVRQRDFVLPATSLVYILFLFTYAFNYRYIRMMTHWFRVVQHTHTRAHTRAYSLCDACTIPFRSITLKYKACVTAVFYAFAAFEQNATSARRVYDTNFTANAMGSLIFQLEKVCVCVLHSYSVYLALS